MKKNEIENNEKCRFLSETKNVTLQTLTGNI